MLAACSLSHLDTFCHGKSNHRRFVERQHEVKLWRCSEKKTEGQADFSDYHKTAKVMPDEILL